MKRYKFAVTSPYGPIGGFTQAMEDEEAKNQLANAAAFWTNNRDVTDYFNVTDTKLEVHMGDVTVICEITEVPDEPRP